MSTRKGAGKFKESRLMPNVAHIWRVMAATGKGYMRHSLRNSGRGNDRRDDKLFINTITDGEGNRTVEKSRRDETKIQRLARYERLGVRHV